MEYLLDLLVWLAALWVCVPMWIVIIEVLSALSYRRARVVQHSADQMPTTVVLIPAHNEEELIGSTLVSLAADLPPECRLLCVAHNCSDSTAGIARKFGAEAIEVNDEGTGGKPDALKAGLLYLDANPPEVVVIVDADCLVSKGAVRLLANEAHRLEHPVMGAYLFTVPEDSRGLANVSSLAIMLKNYIRPLGLRQLGLPCLLNGSGSAYPFEAIRSAPHGEGSIAEDYQLTIDLLLMGYPTTFVPEAGVVGQLPRQQNTAQTQRRRWEHGHLYLSFLTAPRLVLRGLIGLQRDRVMLGLDLFVPPLAFLVGALGLVIFMALFVSLTVGGGPLNILVISSIIFFVSVFVSWMRFAGVAATVSAVAAVPRYIMWKLPIYRDFFSRRETRWMKTKRD